MCFGHSMPNSRMGQLLLWRNTSPPACALERLYPGSFPLVQLDYCEMIYVPTPAR